MAETDFQRIFDALGDAGVRYLVVGGVAVVLHGHPRLTADLDLVLALEPANVVAAVRALEGLGFRPHAPVAATQLADPDARRQLRSDKGLAVFSLFSPALPATDVDILVEEPFPFDEMWARATIAEIGPTRVAVASIGDLIAMKRAAGRARDLDDIAALEAIERIRQEGVHG